MKLSLKKTSLLASFIVLIIIQSFSQTDIHWGSSGDPLHGLVVTWKSMETASQIKWGYTDSYEQGPFNGIRRDDYSGYRGPYL